MSIAPLTSPDGSAFSDAPPVISAPLDLSVVIVSWNTRDLLDDCLRSVFDSLRVRADVWVVDNQSADGSADMVRRKYPQVRLIESGGNLGFARGNNLALARATGRYHLLLNSDTLVPPGAIDGLVAALDKYPNAAVASPLLLNGDGSVQMCWARFPGVRSEVTGKLDRSQSPFSLADFDDPAKRAQMPPFPVDWVGGACFAVRASVTETVGLLDGNFFMYSEETDWCRRFRAAGHDVLLVPALTVTHLGGQSSQTVPLATRRRVYQSARRFYRKAYGPVASVPASLCRVGAVRSLSRQAPGTGAMTAVNSALPRVVLDARPLTHPQAGGFRSYVRSLLQGLTERWAEQGADVELICYVDRAPDEVALAALPPQTETRILGTGRIKADLLAFPRQVRADRPALVHGVSNYLPPHLPARTCLTVHDAMGIYSYPWEAKARWTLRDRLVNRYWYGLTRLSIARASRLITVSHGSAREIARATGLPEARFTVVYNGLPALEAGSFAPPRQERAVLCFHAPDSRKNGEAVYRAFSEYRHLLEADGCPSPTLEIVCTGDKTVARAQAAMEEWGIRDFRLHQGLSDTALRDVFARASVFVWPSRLEGFGLPPLEAMQAGCPVVSSSAPAMPEVLQNAPVFFDPDRADDLALKIAALLSDNPERAVCAEQGRIVASGYTCRRMADETVRVWLDALL